MKSKPDALLPSDKSPVQPATELYFVDGSCGVLFFSIPGGGSSGGPCDCRGSAELILHTLALYYPSSLNYKLGLGEQELSRILAYTFEHMF